MPLYRGAPPACWHCQPRACRAAKMVLSKSRPMIMTMLIETMPSWEPSSARTEQGGPTRRQKRHRRRGRRAAAGRRASLGHEHAMDLHHWGWCGRDGGGWTTTPAPPARRRGSCAGSRTPACCWRTTGETPPVSRNSARVTPRPMPGRLADAVVGDSTRRSCTGRRDSAHRRRSGRGPMSPCRDAWQVAESIST